MKTLYCRNSNDWREWLSENHDQENEVWLVFYKKKTGKPSIEYEAAVEEALCFGWIDSIIKKIDELKYAQKFTPRRDGSVWSESNKKRIAKLIKNKRMTAVGLAKIEAAKKSGKWNKSARPNLSFEMPQEFKQALHTNRVARENFEKLAPTYQKQFIVWIAVAKRAETRKKRISESIQLLEKGQKLGLR
jgi:uncharacterized protein YdeI (YjbR/CyaY-like superfamily)